MTRVRLIDHEGVTVANMALPDPPERPRMYVYAPVPPKITWASLDEDPATLDVKTVEFRLERRDGGGTYIYRRITPLWEGGAT